MIDLVSATVTFDSHTVRGWAGVATDEGVGLIGLVEVSNAARLVCRFEALLPEAARRRHPAWSGPDRDVCQRLLDHIFDQARAAVAAGSLAGLHGRRVEIALSS
jgi:hypothetical protein